MPRYTATTSSNKYLKTSNTHQDKLTITKHELHNNNNNTTSQPYNLTTDLRQSEGFKLANPGTSDSVASNPLGSNNTDERLLTPYTTSEHPGNTTERFVHRHNHTTKATVEYTLPHCQQIILHQPTPHPRYTKATPKPLQKQSQRNPRNPLHSQSPHRQDVQIPRVLIYTTHDQSPSIYAQTDNTCKQLTCLFAEATPTSTPTPTQHNETPLLTHPTTPTLPRPIGDDDAKPRHWHQLHTNSRVLLTPTTRLPTPPKNIELPVHISS